MAAWVAHVRATRRLATVFQVLCPIAVALGTVGCKDPTELILVVVTDVPHDPERNLVIYAGPHAEATKVVARTQGPWGNDGSIGTLVLTPTGSKSSQLNVRVSLGVARNALSCSVNVPEGCIIARRKLSFIEHESLQLPIGLHSRCQGVQCEEDKTCNALGQCVSAEVNAEDCSNSGRCTVPDDRLPAGVISDVDASISDAPSETSDSAAMDSSIDAKDDSGPDAPSDARAEAAQDAKVDVESGSVCPGNGGPSMVKLPAGYCIDATEVSALHYQDWLKGNPKTSGQPSQCTWNTSYKPSCESSGNMPVVCVDWCDAYAYCKAVGKRLCGRIGGGANDYSKSADATLSQWYNACTSGDRNDYPYGDTYQAVTCNGGDAGKGKVLEVKTKPGCQSSVAGYEGVFDLSGNVWEWEDSCQSSTGVGDYCRVRGAAYYGDSGNLLCRGAYHEERAFNSNALGIRCCAL